MQERPIIAFIGAGNMASCLIGGLINDAYPAQQIWAANPHIEKPKRLQEFFGISITTDNIEAATQAQVIVLAIKPQILPTVVKQIAPVVARNKPLVISLASGVRLADIERWLGAETAIIRAMPNTPAMIGEGVSALCPNDWVSPEQFSFAENLFGTVGDVFKSEDEDSIDIIAAVSGSGPAYFFYFMEALMQAGEQLGLEPEIAELLVKQTAYGAALMSVQENADITELRRQVTSPKGTTERAIAVFEQHDIRATLLKGLQAAVDRARQLADELKSIS